MRSAVLDSTLPPDVALNADLAVIAGRALDELFAGDHELLEQAYSPMTIRFFILQAHYRSTLDFSNEALQGSEKGLARMLKAMEELEHVKPGSSSSVDVEKLQSRCDDAMMDDKDDEMMSDSDDGMNDHGDDMKDDPKYIPRRDSEEFQDLIKIDTELAKRGLIGCQSQMSKEEAQRVVPKAKRM